MIWDMDCISYYEGEFMSPLKENIIMFIIGYNKNITKENKF